MTVQEAKEILENNQERKTAMIYVLVKDAAINALDKQIPRKPIIQETSEKVLYSCPMCGKVFFEAYDTVQRGYIPKYCEMCGQSIDF